MDLTPYVENLRRELAVAADAGGEDARALAERLTAPLDVRGAADAARRAVGRRRRDHARARARLGRAAPARRRARTSSSRRRRPTRRPSRRRQPAPPPPPEGDEAATARINLRLPEQLKAGVEQAAARERLSVNAWLVRAAAAAVARDDPDRRPPQRGGRIGESFTGWVR